MSEQTETRWGAAAVARSGDLTIEVDEALNGPDAWQVSIESPRLFVSFSLERIEQLQQALWFLKREGGCAECEELSVGVQQWHPVKIIRDDEIGGRVFLRLTAPAHDVRLTFDANAVAQLTSALSDVVDQLSGD